MSGKFICLCPFYAEPGQGVLNPPPGCTFDADGFLVCSGHGQRRYGWRSIPMIDRGSGQKTDFSKAGWSELEVEQWVLFGVTPPVIHLEVKSGIDLRDNRDPKTMVIRECDSERWIGVRG